MTVVVTVSAATAVGVMTAVAMIVARRERLSVAGDAVIVAVMIVRLWIVEQIGEGLFLALLFTLDLAPLIVPMLVVVEADVLRQEVAVLVVHEQRLLVREFVHDLHLHIDAY